MFYYNKLNIIQFGKIENASSKFRLPKYENSKIKKNLQIDAFALTWRSFKHANYLPDDPKPPEPRCWDSSYFAHCEGLSSSKKI